MTTYAKPRARRALDEVRALLGVVVPHGRACLTCGGLLDNPRAQPQTCPLCGGKQVRAENLVRAVRDGAALKSCAVGLGHGWGVEDRQEAVRRAGAFEALSSPVSGSGRLGIKELL